MLDGLRPDTCVIVVDNIRWTATMMNAQAFDLIQYGCDGDRRVLLETQRIEARWNEVGVPAGQLEAIVEDVNRTLRRRHCTCR